MAVTLQPVDPNPTMPATGSSRPSPKWAKVFAEAMGAGTGGYAYVICRDGEVIDSGEWGYARMPVDGAIAWSIDSRCNLASVSKTVTATAILYMVQEGLITSVNDCFWPYLQPLLPKVTPATGVDTVTIAELLMMTSRLQENGTLYAKPSVEEFLAAYVADNAIIPRQLYVYSNTNFTLLQGVIDSIARQKGYQGYVDYINRNIFASMGVKSAVFSPVPDTDTVATLAYAAELDPPYSPGVYWPEMDCIGPGGWISSARQLAHFAIGLRKASPLSPLYTSFMQRRLLGWYYGGTSWGVCYHHNGGLHRSGANKGSICTGLVSFPQGYDAVLLANKPVESIIGLMIQAFDA